MAQPHHFHSHCKRRAQQTRARIGVIVGLGVFILAQVALGAITEYLRPELRDPTFEIKVRQLVRLRGSQAQPPATVVFLGSSMTANGINAGALDEPLTASLGRPAVAYNLGINGNGPLAHLIHVQRLLRRGVRPDLVVIEVTPLMCDAGEAKIDISRFPGNVLEHAELDTMERYAQEPDLRSDWWQAHLVPIHGHRVMLLNQSARTLVPYSARVELWPDADGHGWNPRPAPDAAEHRRILDQVEAEFKVRWAQHRIGKEPLLALRELADLLARERIAAVFVLMPEGPRMRSLGSNEAIEPVVREFAAICHRHGFPLVPAREWFGEEMFRDSYHLNPAGATAFTGRLLHEVIAPTLGDARMTQRP